MIALSVNLNKIALIRNSRDTSSPDLPAHATMALAASSCFRAPSTISSPASACSAARSSARHFSTFHSQDTTCWTPWATLQSIPSERWADDGYAISSIPCLALSRLRFSSCLFFRHRLLMARDRLAAPRGRRRRSTLATLERNGGGALQRAMAALQRVHRQCSLIDIQM